MSRIRANQITNQAADGAPTVQHGLIIAGVSTFTGSVSIGGTLTYEDVTNIDSIGIVTARGGIHIDDSIIHIGDTNTKIRFPAADTITAETGGSERLRIHSDGKLSLGTSSSASAKFNISHGNELALYTSGPYNYQAKFESTDAEAAIVIEDVNSGSNYNRIGVITNDMTFITNNNERLRITSDGYLKIGGHSANRDVGGLSAQMVHLEGTSGSASISLINNQNSGGNSALYLGKSRGTSIGSNVILQNGDPMGSIVWCGSDGNDMISQGAVITAEVDGTPGSNDMPGRLVFKTTADGAATSTERLRIASNGFVGINEDDPQTELNVRGTISTGRNVARELGTIINISANYSASRNGVNVINGKKNFENGSNDWLVNFPVNANLTIDLGVSVNCDRFVIYNQNEYANSKREVKRFTLEGSNNNSSWTTVLDDECGASNGHEPNPGWSFRIPSNITDDDEGNSYRYWKFTMKTFPSSNDSYGGVMELELYEASDDLDGEITTSSLSAGTVNASIVQTVAQPSFHARLINHKNADQDPLIFDDVLVNVGNHYYSTGSDAGKFVVPVRGTYFFFWEAIKNGSSGVSRLYLMKNNARIYNSMHLRLQEEGNYANGCMNVIMQLEPEDRIHIDLEDGGVHASEYTHFGGYLIG